MIRPARLARQRLPAFAIAVLLLGCGSDTTESSSASTVLPSTTTEVDQTPSTDPTTSVDDSTTTSAEGDTFFPDIIAAVATREDSGTWRFDVTVSSPYDSPEQYADAWRVLHPDGTELGIRILTHDHASEQPFTRSQGGITIPDDVTAVTIEGRDLENGWGGGTLDLDLP